jgi:hypothetical protein
MLLLLPVQIVLEATQEQKLQERTEECRRPQERTSARQHAQGKGSYCGLSRIDAMQLMRNRM